MVAGQDQGDPRIQETGRYPSSVLPDGLVDEIRAGPALVPKVVETHSAVLFFAGDRVYKAKKALDLGFLDHTTLAARLAVCRREVELNRRLAPDVYLGVADLVGPDGAISEHLVVMRRLPEDRSLTNCLLAGEDVDDALRDIAHAIATLHARAAVTGPSRQLASTESVRGNWNQSFAQLHALTGADVDPTVAERIEVLVERYLAGRDDLFAHRIAEGCVVDGHGDLQADDIYLMPDGPRILDCIEFGDRYRISDSLSDVAFLAMDLERLGHPDLGRRFLDVYRDLAAGTWPPSLAHHYIAYRAHVRAKVRALRQIQSGRPADPGVAARMDLALAHLERARVRLVLVGGLPGTGKSTIAEALADEIDAIVLRTDDVRRRMPSQAADVDRYQPESVRAVYVEMLGEAEQLLRLGRHVVLDATWQFADIREEARRVALATSSDLTELVCDAPGDLAVRRIVRRQDRGDDPSEATAAVASAMATRFAPWPEARMLDTVVTVPQTTRHALAAVGWPRPVTETMGARAVGHRR